MADPTTTRRPRSVRIAQSEFDHSIARAKEDFPSMGTITGFMVGDFTQRQLDAAAKATQDQGDHEVVLDYLRSANRSVRGSVRGFLRGMIPVLEAIMYQVEDKVPADILSEAELDSFWGRFDEYCEIANEHHVNFPEASRLYKEFLVFFAQYLPSWQEADVSILSSDSVSGDGQASAIPTLANGERDEVAVAKELMEEEVSA